MAKELTAAEVAEQQATLRSVIEERMAFEPVRVEVAKLSLAAGDVIVLKLKGFFNTDRQNSFRRYLGRFFPENNVLILDGGTELEVVQSAPNAEPWCPRCNNQGRPFRADTYVEKMCAACSLAFRSGAA